MKEDTWRDKGADYYRHVIQTCFPAFSVRTIVFLAAGWGSTVWEVNGSYIFRFPKRPEIGQGLLKEIRLLPVLAIALPLRLPHIEYIWQGGPEYEGLFVGYLKIPGVPLTLGHLASTGSTKLSQQLGRFLTALHLFPLEQAVAVGIPEGGSAQWRQQYRAFYQTVRQRVFPLLGVQEWRRIAAAWEAFLDDQANFRFVPVLIHADLNSEHILFAAELGGITGIIDWEDAAIGDPALDFTGLLGDYGYNFVSQVLAAYNGPADGGMLARARFYDAIASCHEVLFGLDCGLAQHITFGLKKLQTVWSAPEALS